MTPTWIHSVDSTLAALRGAEGELARLLDQTPTPTTAEDVTLLLDFRRRLTGLDGAAAEHDRRAALDGLRVDFVPAVLARIAHWLTGVESTLTRLARDGTAGLFTLAGLPWFTQTAAHLGTGVSVLRGAVPPGHPLTALAAECPTDWKYVVAGPMESLPPLTPGEWPGQAEQPRTLRAWYSVADAREWTLRFWQADAIQAEADRRLAAQRAEEAAARRDAQRSDAERIRVLEAEVRRLEREREAMAVEG